jgi:hypothetical protein
MKIFPRGLFLLIFPINIVYELPILIMYAKCFIHSILPVSVTNAMLCVEQIKYNYKSTISYGTWPAITQIT